MNVVVWNTPFSGQFFPSMELVPIPTVANAVDLVVYPGGNLDRYPAHIAHFEHVPAYRSYYEGMEPSTLPILESNLKTCSFIIENSDWKKEFERVAGYIETSFGRSFSDLQHFVVVGGDHVVEILAYPPVFEVLEGPRLVRELKV